MEALIKVFKERIETHKDTAEFVKLTGELNKSRQKKDQEHKNSKKKKYQKVMGDYQRKQVFKWQTTLENKMNIMHRIMHIFQ